MRGESSGVSRDAGAHDTLHLDRTEVEGTIRSLLASKDVGALRLGVKGLEEHLVGPGGNAGPGGPGDIVLRADVVRAELRQALEARTLTRAKHYLRRFQEGLKEPKFGEINEINLRRWKEYDEVWTDSLWVMGRRDTSGAHVGWYWGNFVPEIPRQMMLRYTRKGDWVLDAFAGSGTTLIECRRLGRNGIGVELSPKVAASARRLVAKEANVDDVKTEVLVGDSSRLDLRPVLKSLGAHHVDLLIMHPPYHDIIKFSDDPDDLSNASDVSSFLAGFSACVENVAPLLARGRYMALVIGDKYSRGEWIPLGFLCMESVLRRKDFSLKSIIVKNFERTRGKRSSMELWRYRALAGGFYVFKHEYIFVFRKRGAA